jgi:FkbM family methyltransferase
MRFNLMDDLSFWLAYAYIKAAYLTRGLGYRMKGIGFIAIKLIRKDRAIKCNGLSFYLRHEIAGSYGVMIAGYWNEPETHIFLKSVFNSLARRADFIDVGANIGEMIADVARMPNVRNVIAIEPHPVCAAACVETAKLNGFASITVRQVLLSDRPKVINYSINAASPNASCMTDMTADSVCMDASTLDIETAAINNDAILLIDVEGSELDVIRGGREFINRCKPLIIFEYNEVSRQKFHVDDIARELGPQYAIYRLRSNDGFLDGHVQYAWNCVAVHGGSVFNHICDQLICKE